MRQIGLSCCLLMSAVIRNDWGLDGQDYGFWPMLIGGFFLYGPTMGVIKVRPREFSRQSDAASQSSATQWLLRFPIGQLLFAGVRIGGFTSKMRTLLHRCHYWSR